MSPVKTIKQNNMRERDSGATTSDYTGREGFSKRR